MLFVDFSCITCLFGDQQLKDVCHQMKYWSKPALFKISADFTCYYFFSILWYDSVNLPSPQTSRIVYFFCLHVFSFLYISVGFLWQDALDTSHSSRLLLYAAVCCKRQMKVVTVYIKRNLYMCNIMQYNSVKILVYVHVKLSWVLNESKRIYCCIWLSYFY